MQVVVWENCTIMLYCAMDCLPDGKFTWCTLGGYKFTDDRELETIIYTMTNKQNTDFYQHEIQEIILRYDRCVNCGRENVEKIGQEYN